MTIGAKITFEGNIGKDPEMKSCNNGDFVTSSVGVYEKKDETTWYNLTAFGHRSKELFEAKKGDRVEIFGRFKPRPWKNKEGVEKISMDVTVLSCVVLPKFKSATGTQQPEVASKFSDDLPF